MTPKEQQAWLLNALASEYEILLALFQRLNDQRVAVAGFNPEDAVARVKMNAMERHLRRCNILAALDNDWRKFIEELE